MLRQQLRLTPTQLRTVPRLSLVPRSRFESTTPLDPTPAPEAHPVDAAELGQDGRRNRFLYFSGTTPIRSQFGWWDFRPLFAKFEEENVNARIKDLIPKDPEFDVQVEGIYPRSKDGGVFAKFSFVVPEGDPAAEKRALEKIEAEAKAAYQKQTPTGWTRLTNLTGGGGVFLVKGVPWAEDMTHRSRFPNRTLRIEFDGPELGQEETYALFRPYGKIYNIVPQAPSDKSTPRFVTVIFTSARAASAARNALHAAVVPTTHPGGAPSPPTALRILYAEPESHQYVKDFITGHPRISIPALIALLGVISALVLDPVREVAVETHVKGTFDAEKYTLVRWLKRETLGRLGYNKHKVQSTMSGVERERAEAKEQLASWLKDTPNSFITITGPVGSGKTALVGEVLEGRENVLIVDCAAILKNGRTETKLVSEVADAVGYWPLITLGASVNNLIDLASMSLTGQKAGFSSALDVQLKSILEVAASGISSVAGEARVAADKASKAADKRREIAETQKDTVEPVIEKIAEDGLKDARMDEVAGNGAMTGLGGGVENATEDEAAILIGPKSVSAAKALAEAITPDSTEESAQLPIVVLKNYASKGEAKNDLLWDVMAEWAAVLVENQVAHVIISSDSVTANKPLAHALPNSPFHQLRLQDASEEAAWNYVETKLGEADKQLRPDQRSYVAQLGGRQTDLELLVQKIHAGFELEAAVDDLIERNAQSIRKAFFGDDIAEAEKLPWSPSQAYALVKGLTEHEELVYGSVLVNQFKSNESALRALETAELISVIHKDGRPSRIVPGKPVYRSAFLRLRQDRGWEAALRYRINQASQKSAGKDLADAEGKLGELSRLFSAGSGAWVFGGGMRVPEEVEERVGMLLAGMRNAEERLRKLGKEEHELLETLAKVE